MHTPRPFIAIIPLLAITFTNVVAQSEYTLVRFDTPSGTAHGINNRGQVVGSHVGEDLFTAPFVWQNGTLITLDALGDGQAGVAHDINNRGQIVGSSSTGSAFEVRAILWENGQPIVLESLSTGDFSFSEAYGINDRGLIAGVSNTSTALRPVIWAKGEVVDLGTPAGYGAGWALDINEQGQAVGYVIPSSPADALQTHAALWDDGHAIDLGVLPGDTFSVAYGINNRGQVVGISGNQPAGTERAFIWENGVMQEIAPPPGYAFARALDISDSGRIAGAIGNVNPIAAVYDNGTWTILPSNDGQANFAEAINGRGDAAGFADSGPALWVRTP
jgi:probable HAF family extracellular repeat protein